MILTWFFLFHLRMRYLHYNAKMATKFVIITRCRGFSSYFDYLSAWADISGTNISDRWCCSMKCSIVCGYRRKTVRQFPSCYRDNSFEFTKYHLHAHLYTHLYLYEYICLFVKNPHYNTDMGIIMCTYTHTHSHIRIFLQVCAYSHIRKSKY